MTARSQRSMVPIVSRIFPGGQLRNFILLDQTPLQNIHLLYSIYPSSLDIPLYDQLHLKDWFVSWRVKVDHRWRCHHYSDINVNGVASDLSRFCWRLQTFNLMVINGNRWFNFINVLPKLLIVFKDHFVFSMRQNVIKYFYLLIEHITKLKFFF